MNFISATFTGTTTMPPSANQEFWRPRLRANLIPEPKEQRDYVKKTMIKKQSPHVPILNAVDAPHTDHTILRQAWAYSPLLDQPSTVHKWRSQRVRRLKRKLDQGLFAMLDRVDSMQDALSAQIRPSTPVLSLAMADTAPDTYPPHFKPMSTSGQQEATLALTAARVSATEPTSQDTETRQESIPAEFLGVAPLDPPHTEFTFDASAPDRHCCHQNLV
ncbi:hypothetical protein L210DRAFT_3760358 [Boletus edulis BED1]|uniref:Uncharacterized protein n=1 Tax=Boletus edulis BED1 TaxID=1328754 RepID=A0AAD4BV89_BOLED|nr:hypothetical protein L210DRAFT_3760358 [Boletus edulis BED1]